MQSETEEANAIETLDGAEWMGRELRVNKARPRENSQGDNVASSDMNRDRPLFRNY